MDCRRCKTKFSTLEEYTKHALMCEPPSLHLFEIMHHPLRRLTLDYRYSPHPLSVPHPLSYQEEAEVRKRR